MDRKKELPLKRSQFGIKQLFWLTLAVAVSAAIVKIDIATIFLLVPLWLATFSSLVTHVFLRWKLPTTLIFSFLALDIGGALFVGFCTWLVRSNPSHYPNSITLGDSLTAFMIGLLVLAPAAAGPMALRSADTAS